MRAVAFGLACWLVFSSTVSHGQTLVVSPSTHISVGKTTATTSLDHLPVTFHVTNGSSQSITLTETGRSCTCLNVRLDNSVLSPHEATTITLALPGKALGYVTASASWIAEGSGGQREQLNLSADAEIFTQLVLAPPSRMIEVNPAASTPLTLQWTAILDEQFESPKFFTDLPAVTIASVESLPSQSRGISSYRLKTVVDLTKLPALNAWQLSQDKMTVRLPLQIIARAGSEPRVESMASVHLARFADQRKTAATPNTHP
jgi:hypothetical protein